MTVIPVEKYITRRKYLLGEVTLLFSLISVAVILVGAWLGTNITLSRQLRTTFGRASEEASKCSFRTTFGVYKEMPDGTTQPLTQQDATISSWGVSNDKQMQKNAASPFQTFADKTEKTFETASLPLKPIATAEYADKDKAAVTLFAQDLSEKYQLTKVFCNSNNNGAGCPTDISTQVPGMSIQNFEITCGVDINYGWIVSPKNSPSIMSPTPQSSLITPSTEISPTSPISQTPPDTSTNSKNTYSLFLWSAEHGGDDMCFINADNKLGQHVSQGAHCKVTSCKDKETNEPTSLIVDFANQTNPAEDPLNLSAQINHCPDKVLGELAGVGKNECNNFVARKDNFPVGHGKKVRCLWKNPKDKANVALNFTCQEVRDNDPRNPQDVCAGTSPKSKTKLEGYRLDPFPYNKIINIEIPKPNGAYAISAILHKDSAVVTDQTDYSYSWSITDNTIADIKPFDGCTNGIQEPCPYDHLSVTAKKAGSTTITVSVKRKDTRDEIATLDYTLYVNSPNAPTSAVSLAPTKAKNPAPTRSSTPRLSSTKTPTRKPQPTTSNSDSGTKVVIKKEQVAFNWDSKFEKIGLAQDKITGFKFGICDTDVQAAHMKTRANGGAKCKWFPTDATSKEIILNAQKPSKGTIKPLADISVDFDGNPLLLNSGKDYYATCQYFEINEWSFGLYDPEWRRCKPGKLDLDAIKRGEPLTFLELLDAKQYFLVPFNVALSDGGIEPIPPKNGKPYLGLSFLFKQDLKITLDDTVGAFKVGLCPTEKLDSNCKYFSAHEAFNYRNSSKVISFLTSIDASNEPLKAGSTVYATCQFLTLDANSPTEGEDALVVRCKPRPVKVREAFSPGSELYYDPWGNLPSRNSNSDVVVFRNQGTASIPLFSSLEDTVQQPDTEDFQYTICDPDTGTCDVIEQNAFSSQESTIYSSSSTITSLSNQKIISGKDYEITCQYRSENGDLVSCGTKTAIGGSPVFFDTFISPDSSPSFNAQNAIDRCDRNSDGACTIVDIAQCQAVAYGKQTQACDMNNDRFVDAADISMLFDYAGAAN